MQEFWFDILHFTLLQACLSAGGAVVLGVLLARFLYYYPGLRLKRALLSLGDLIFVMPVMVASLGFLLMFEGYYGLTAIVGVHVFLTTLYGTGQILKGYEGFLSHAQHQQHELLRLTAWERFKYAEVPGVLPVIGQTFLVIFCLCLSSFSSILLLGGGPASTTLSVALYHSLSVSFDLSEAAFFLSLQVMVSLVFALLLADIKKVSKTVNVFKRETQKSRVQRGAGEILLGTLFVLYLLPLGRLLATAMVLPPDLLPFCKACALTLGLGVGTSFLTTLLAVGILTSYLTQGRALKTSFSVIVTALLSLPKIALVGGFFLFFYDFLSTLGATYVLIIGVGSLCYLPFVLKSLLHSFKGLQEAYGPHIQLLSLSMREVMALLVWPSLQGTLLKNASIVMCFAMGNLSVPLLLGQMEVKTLPVLSYQALLRYDTELSGFYMLCLIILMALVMLLTVKRTKNVAS